MSEDGVQGPLDKGLRTGSLGFLALVVIGVASTAPAYSIASTLGGISFQAGLQSPATVLLGFVPMFLVAIAYRELNRAEPDCGTTFTWAAMAFGPRTGWLGGWGIIATDVIVMSNLAEIAGSYTFQLLGLHGLASSQLWVTVLGVAWIAILTTISYRGVALSARVQTLLLATETVVLIGFSATALVRVYTGHGPSVDGHPVSQRLSLEWFNPFLIHGFGPLAAGLLLATFIYWGWDAAVATNEESVDASRIPGAAAVLSTVLLLVTYVLVTVSAQAFAGVGDKGLGLTNPEHGSNVLSGLGSAVFGSTGIGSVLAHLLILMVITSAAASAQSTILPTARSTLSMAAYKALPDRFARVHPRFQTPTWSTVLMGAVSILFYVLMTRISTSVLTDTVASVGLLIAFYYGLTAFACTWFYRKTLTDSWSSFLNRCALPLAGGLMLGGLFVYGIVYYADPSHSDGEGVSVFGHRIGAVSFIGLVSLVLGVVLMAAYRRARPAFFRGETLPKSVAPAIDRTATAAIDAAVVPRSEGAGGGRSSS